MKGQSRDVKLLYMHIHIENMKVLPHRWLNSYIAGKSRGKSRFKSRAPVRTTEAMYGSMSPFLLTLLSTSYHIILLIHNLCDLGFSKCFWDFFILAVL